MEGSFKALNQSRACAVRVQESSCLPRYREVVEIVLHFRESKEKQIQRAVISLIPRLAAFAPERFAATYLDTCVDYLISIVK